MQEQRASEVAHQPHQPTSAAPVATTKATSGAILENAAASVSSALQSARETSAGKVYTDQLITSSKPSNQLSILRSDQRHSDWKTS
ncbi:hypothetical protein L1987_68369 [Smallanthus sonchifolius]|uniref:Uncharacterized protein n=1 Tax=Smallanthus sonchifolius TaxID=185202 RepID=A0ACB9B3V2_9ASTR|nr:hypothetical protein L1987_68369 [Smallanthus sonchifolius]